MCGGGGMARLVTLDGDGDGRMRAIASVSACQHRAIVASPADI